MEALYACANRGFACVCLAIFSVCLDVLFVTYHSLFSVCLLLFAPRGRLHVVSYGQIERLLLRDSRIRTRAVLFPRGSRIKGATLAILTTLHGRECVLPEPSKAQAIRSAIYIRFGPSIDAYALNSSITEEGP